MSRNYEQAVAGSLRAAADKHETGAHVTVPVNGGRPHVASDVAARAVLMPSAVRGLPHIRLQERPTRLHDVALQAGVPLEMAAEQLEHASVAVRRTGTCT